MASNEAARAPASNASPAPRSSLPWILLALWVVWFGAMLWISRGQWGVSRVPAETAPVGKRNP